jgi:hypothetical protein
MEMICELEVPATKTQKEQSFWVYVTLYFNPYEEAF